MRGFGSTTFVLLALVGAACSDGDAAPATTTDAPVTAAPTTSAPSTTATPVTTAPPTVASTAPPTVATTAPASTAPPTPAPGSVEEQVVAAALESWRLFNEALADPFNDEKAAAAGRAHTGTNQQTVIEILADYRINNWRSTPNPEVPTTVVPYAGGVVVDQAAGTASVTYCFVNSNIVVQTGANPDGSDLVVNDDVSSSRVRVDLELIDGKWLDSSGELIQEWKGAPTCPDLP